MKAERKVVISLDCYEIKETNVTFGGSKEPGVISMGIGTIYEPIHFTANSRIAVVYNQAPNGVGQALAKRGFRCMEISRRGMPPTNPDIVYVEMSEGIKLMKNYPGVELVLGASWSGGNVSLTAYQALAENGCGIFQCENMLMKISDLPPLVPFDGLISLDPNWGAIMQLLSLDPSVRIEGNGMDLDPALNMFDTANGFCEGGCCYPDEFIERFQRGQAARMKRLVSYCQERLSLIDAGKGLFEDDEPLVIVSGQSQRDNNLLFPQDVRLLCRTHSVWPLIHADGSITEQVVPCIRIPMYFKSHTRSMATGAKVTSVKNFLRNGAVQVTDGFRYGADYLEGVDVDVTFGCTFGNVKHITVPYLICGMTASWEFVLAETLYYNAASTDKSIIFIEGARHNFDPETAMEKRPGEFGDTRKNLFDYISAWIGDGSRF